MMQANMIVSNMIPSDGGTSNCAWGFEPPFHELGLGLGLDLLRGNTYFVACCCYPSVYPLRCAGPVHGRQDGENRHRWKPHRGWSNVRRRNNLQLSGRLHPPQLRSGQHFRGVYRRHMLQISGPPHVCSMGARRNSLPQANHH